MTERFDVIVVGGGHNGLVCAALLGKAGKRVLLLEANEQVGGAAVTQSFADGYAVSSGAHLLYQLQPKVLRDLGINLRYAADDMETLALNLGGNAVRMHGCKVEGVSAADAGSFSEFQTRMRRYAKLLNRYLNRTPPRLGTKDIRDWMTLGKLGFDVRRLGKEDMQEFLRLIGMNIHDELMERFDNPLLRGALAFDAVLGTHLGPRSPNTVLTYLYRLAANKGQLKLPAGGMGSVSNALAQEARAAGVSLRLQTPVQRIIVENGRITGVETCVGERFDSYTVVSNADPKRTVLSLVGAQHFESAFAQKIHRQRAQGNAAKLHLALDGLPDIKGIARKDFAQRLLIAPDERYVERAFNPAKYGECSIAPVIEMTFPSIRDETLAPTGKHVMSAVVQYAPYALKGGWDDAAKTEFERTVLDTIERYAPDIRKRIVASELLTPVDIESRFHISGGHWHHGELVLDQFFFVRPVAGAAQYQLPLDGLFVCGAGAHPGGGVSGAAGRNAAREILRRDART